MGSLAQLDAIRYDLDGDGSPTNSTAYDAAFPNAVTGMGCPSTGCTGYELTTNLDFDTNGNGEADSGDDYWNDGAGWEPIDGDGSGYQDQYFHATFEGNSHVISGLYIDRSGEGDVGFFGRVWGGEIRNLGLEGVFVKGGRDTGGLVGNTISAFNPSLISASYVTGSVSGGSLVGGMVGFSQASINASYAAVSVTGTSNIGGLVGSNHGSGSISASYATGAVTGGGQVGGLVGSSQAGSITASYATGSVSGNLYVGGLVGDSDRGTITASYATGSVYGWVAGGLVGSNFGTIAASYAIGAVSGSSPVGGLVGRNSWRTFTGTATASYWDTETSGQSTSAGGEGKTTSELQSPTSNTGIYSTWDGDVWDFGTSSEYPNLIGDGPASASLGAPTIGAVTPGGGSLAISWTAPSSDGGSAVTAYDLRHIETAADETDDSNWTVVDDVWATGGGNLQYTLTGLTGGTQYDLQVRAVNAGGDGPWSATATGTPTATARATSAGDYDADDDGLIEVGSLAQLDAIRYDLDGDGSPTDSTAYDAAFPNAATGMGCPSEGCTGYELTTNLDFDTNGDGRTDVAGDTYWNGGAGWEPIGDGETRFNATFDGNGHTISNLYMHQGTDDFINAFAGAGLFGNTETRSVIRGIGLINVDVTIVRHHLGGLVGSNKGAIANSYATGKVSGGGSPTGGLVGVNYLGTITGSYATASVYGEHYVGGLAGSNDSGTVTGSYSTGGVTGGDLIFGFNPGGLIGHNYTSFVNQSYSPGVVTNGYSTGNVTGSNARAVAGGLVGRNASVITSSYATGNSAGGGLVGVNSNRSGDTSGTVTASYWDTETSGQSTSDGGEGKTTSELQSPTSNTGIYATWDDDVWDFGTSSDYPSLIGVGPASASLGAPTIGAVTPGGGSLAISWTAPSSDGGSAVTAYDLRHIETSADETVDSNWTVVDDVWTTGGGTLQYTLTGLTGGTQYDLQIRAVNAGGDGPWSATATGTPTTPGDREFLVALYNATDGANWTNNTNWLSDEPLGDWHGVTTDDEGRVTRLALSINNLAGTIPADLGSLSELTVLDLDFNELTGSIPTELGSLSELTLLELYGNDLSGAIPTELGSLSNLTRLSLGANELTGGIPTELGSLSNLTMLELEDGNLTGGIPMELGSLSNLTSLELDRNDLTGTIPGELGSLTNLTWLSLHGNELTGEIPPALGNLANLANLFLSGNRLTGCIPAGLQDVPTNDFDQLDLSPCSPPGASTIGAVATGMGTLFMSWTPPWNDGRSRITAYDLRYIETEADETDESNWTVVDDVWTTGGGTLPVHPCRPHRGRAVRPPDTGGERRRRRALV